MQTSIALATKLNRYVAGRYSVITRDVSELLFWIPLSVCCRCGSRLKTGKSRSPAGEFGDSLLEHDHNVGRILDELADANLENDTIVIWASDNGSPRSRQ